MQRLVLIRTTVKTNLRMVLSAKQRVAAYEANVVNAGNIVERNEQNIGTVLSIVMSALWQF